MPKIVAMRSILLSAPYANPETNLEKLNHVLSGYRTCGMVEITLDDGTSGLGEGYLAVFAPRVFESMIDLLKPLVINRDIKDYESIYYNLMMTSGYWSLQGAAQHALSAIEIALMDCRAKAAGLPLYKFLNSKAKSSLKLYASGGDSCHPEAMAQEFEIIKALGIDTFKIRARKEDVNKANWCLQKGVENGIDIAIDMTQNLAMPSQSLDDILNFLKQLKHTDHIAFIEEAFGPDSVEDFPLLRSVIDIPITGGEIVTTFRELKTRIEQGYYDYAQPDATVMGGIQAVLNLFAIANQANCEIYVHCWGGAVGMMANYHAALAGGGTVAELPLPEYPLRTAMASWHVQAGQLTLDDSPGLGVHLTSEIENEFAFREDAIYHCLVQDSKKLPDSVWS